MIAQVPNHEICTLDMKVIEAKTAVINEQVATKEWVVISSA